MYTWYIGAHATFESSDEQQAAYTSLFNGPRTRVYVPNVYNKFFDDIQETSSVLFDTLKTNGVSILDSTLDSLDDTIVVRKTDSTETKRISPHISSEVLFSLLMRERGDEYKLYTAPILAVAFESISETAFVTYCLYKDAGPTLKDLYENVMHRKRHGRRDTSAIEASFVSDKDLFLKRLKAPFEFLRRNRIFVRDFHHDNVCVRLENGVPTFRLIDFELYKVEGLDAGQSNEYMHNVITRALYVDYKAKLESTQHMLEGLYERIVSVQSKKPRRK